MLSERKRKVELSKNKNVVLKGDETRAVKKGKKNNFALSERLQEYGYARRGKRLLNRKETIALPQRKYCMTSKEEEEKGC
jgi:hypothetical protein